MHLPTIQENDDESKDLYAANPAGSTLEYARANGRGHNLGQFMPVLPTILANFVDGKNRPLPDR
jgi:hypothetical protein